MFRRFSKLVPRSPRALGAISLLLLLGMLIACLWPFRAPKNSVSWLTHGHGVAFGTHGVLLDPGSFSVAGNHDEAACSLELWLQPDPANDVGTILGIYSVENPRQFTIDQWHSGLALRSASPGDPMRTGSAPSYTHGVFTPGKSVFVTVTSGQQGTQIYVDGKLQKVTPTFRIANRMLSGKLVAGTGAETDNGWPGQLRGLAIYDHVLSPAQVLQHYTSWAGAGRPEIGEPGGTLALYLFEEGKGSRIRNEVSGSNDLYMPERYVVPAKPLLAPPSLEHWDDIIANIAGFVPLGFTLCGYLLSTGRTRLAVVITIVFCGMFSLFVESVQVFLPTRDSDLTDVLTNLLGGAIGALLYRWGVPGGSTTSEQPKVSQPMSLK
jgi:VanZ family protein